MSFVRRPAALAAVLFACVVPASLAGSYPQVGGGSGHLSVASGGGPFDLSSPRFLAGPSLYWANQSGVAVGGGNVVGLMEFVSGSVIDLGVVAVDEFTGEVLWTTAAPDLVNKSWSSPSIDERNAVVVAASGNQVIGLSLLDGHQMWYLTAATGKSFVNASPTIADGTAYIVEWGSGSKLYAIDTATGQLRWQAAVGYLVGNNTVAVNATRVLLVTSDGRFRTFDRQSGAADVNVTISANGFFGTVACEDGAAYAVSFAFGTQYGQTKLYKIDPATGVLIWSVVAPRTDTSPVVTDTMVLVSGGDGYPVMNDGTDMPGLWAFDKGDGHFLWKTNAAGGWTCQPVLCTNGLVYVPSLVGPVWGGRMTGKLYAFDTTFMPQDPSFTVGSTSQIACSAAAANGNVYGTGLYGLAAFGPAPIAGDINGDGAVDVIDLLYLIDSWGTVVGDAAYNVNCDFDGSGSIDVIDLLTLVEVWGSELAAASLADRRSGGRCRER